MQPPKMSIKENILWLLSGAWNFFILSSAVGMLVWAISHLVK